MKGSGTFLCLVFITTTPVYGVPLTGHASPRVNLSQRHYHEETTTEARFYPTRVQTSQYTIDSNAPGLGNDWLHSNDLESQMSEESKERVKRALGEGLGNVSFLVHDVASQAIDTTEKYTEFDVGDSVTLLALFDLPKVPAEDKNDLVFELFGLDPDNGVTGFHICQAHMKEFVEEDYINAIQDYPIYEAQYYPNHPGVIGKSRVVLEQLHNEDRETNTNKSLIQVQFSAIMLDIGETLTGASASLADKSYFITAGVEYGNEEYVWIGQQEVKVVQVPMSYDSTFGFDPSPATEIFKGSGIALTIKARITDPSIPVEVVIFQPLGYVDVFNFGRIRMKLSNAFACSSTTHWEATEAISHTTLSVKESILKHPMLINREAERDVSKEINEVEIVLPIHMMHIKDGPEDTIREVAVAVKLGNKKLFSALHELNIKPYKEEDKGTNTVTVHNDKISEDQNHLNESSGLIAGNAKVFRVPITLVPGWTDITVSIPGDMAEGVYAVGCRFIDTGTIAYIPPYFAVMGLSGETLGFAYGHVQNVDSEDTTAILEIIYGIDPTRETGTIDLTGKLPEIGGETVNLPTFDVETNLNPKEITVRAVNENFFNDSLAAFHSGSIGLTLEIEVPPGAGTENVVIEAIPEFENDVVMKLCRIRVMEIGAGLPCLHFAKTKSKEVYSKSEESKLYKDYGTIDIGNLCPVNYLDGGPRSNKFLVQAVYGLPNVDNEATLTDGTSVRVNMGIKLGDKDIWVASKEYLSLGRDATLGSDVPFAVTGFEDIFVTAIPSVTMRDAQAPSGQTDPKLMIADGFMVPIIFKTQPGSMGTYHLEIVVPQYVKVCKVEVVQQGENYPCLEVAPETLEPEEAAKHDAYLTYDDPLKPCGSPVTLSMWSLSNWGSDPNRHPMREDLYPDENSITVNAYMKVCSPAESTMGIPTMTASHTGRLGQDGVTFAWNSGNDEKTAHISYAVREKQSVDEFISIGYLELQVLHIERQTPPIDFGTLVEVKHITGTETDIFTNAPKVMQIAITAERPLTGDIHVVVSNVGSNPARDVIEFCTLQLIYVGDNFPCMEISEDGFVDSNPPNTVDNTDSGELSIPTEKKFIIRGLCNFAFQSGEESSILGVEAVMRARYDAVDSGEDYKVKIDVYKPGEEGTGYSKTFTMTPKLAEEGTHINSSSLTAEEVNIEFDPMTSNYSFIDPLDIVDPTEANFGEKNLIGFRVTIPTGKTLKMEASFMSSVEETLKRPSFHFTGAFFGYYVNGTNIPCTSSETDLQKTYETVYSSTNRILTHMQKDAMSIDLGYIVNTAVTQKHELYNETHDHFVIMAEYIVSDTPDTTDSDVANEIFFSVKFGDVIVVTSREVFVKRTVDRDDTINEEGNIKIEASLAGDDHVYAAKSQLQIDALFYHDNDSLAEGYPGLIFIYTPKYVEFVPADDSIMTNYTDVVGADVTVTNVRTGLISITFAPGFAFPDVVTFNLTLSVDPAETRPVGSGEDSGQIVLAPVCDLVQYRDTYPPTGKTRQSCGSPVMLSFVNIAPDCSEDIITGEFNAVASSKMSSAHGPENILSSGSTVWSPMVRSGAEWKHWIEIDFRDILRITGASLAANVGASARKINKVMFQYCNIPGYPVDMEEVDVSSGSADVTFVTPIETRFLRISLLELEAGKEDSAVSLNGLTLKGCSPKFPEPQKQADFFNPFYTADNDPTIDASSDTYRQFAVDDALNILYFCDRWPDLEGTICFSHNHDVEPHTFTELPRFIQSITGYDATDGGVWFNEAQFRSTDGKKFVDKRAESKDSTPFTKAVSVPGTSNLTPKSWTGAARNGYKADFDGIYRDNRLIVQWKSCCTP